MSQTGLLDVGDGHRIHFEVDGPSDGVPVVVLHGGPGSGSSPALGACFDRDHYRVVAFDQRGCGRSTPNAGDPAADLNLVTTDHLIADVERLRAHLGLNRWMLFGASWGSTLALAYAERHPDRAAALLLAGVTMTRRREIEWLYQGIAPLFPSQWRRFCGGVGRSEDDVVDAFELIEAYASRLADDNAEVRERAAADWHDWEAASLSPDPNAQPPRRWADAGYRQTRARIVTHFFRHCAWLGDRELLDGADALADTPGIMVQGRLDLAAPLTTAWHLAEVWPKAELVIVPNAGHSVSEQGMRTAIEAAAERLKTL